MDENFNPLKTLAEMAQEQGKKVGIVSSVSIDHATPAAFYAHVKTRKMYREIDHALAEPGFDYFGGGGLKDPAGKKSKAPMGDALAKIEANGYKIETNKEDFQAIKPGDVKTDPLVLADYQIAELKSAFKRSMKGEKKANGEDYLLYGANCSGR